MEKIFRLNNEYMPKKRDVLDDIAHKYCEVLNQKIEEYGKINMNEANCVKFKDYLRNLLISYRNFL